MLTIFIGENILPTEYQDACISKIENLKPKSVMSMIKTIGESLSIQIKRDNNRNLFEELKTHQSDSVRYWASYIVEYDQTLSIAQKLKQIQCFTADSHFGVREISWMAVREDIRE